MTSWLHRADGEAAGTAVGLNTSGPDHFNFISAGGGFLTYETDSPPYGDGYMRSTNVGGSGTPNAQTDFSELVPVIFSRFLFQMPTLPPSNVTFWRSSEEDGTGATSVRVRSDGTIDALSNSFSVLSSFAHKLVAGEWVRLEINVDTVAQEMSWELYHGANLLGSTPDEAIGPISGTVGDGGLTEVRFGIGTNVAAQTMHYDEMALSDEDWIGPPTPAPVAPTGLRAELVDHLRTELGDGIYVYNVGAEVIAVPAIVLTFGNPASVVANFGGGQGLTTALNLVAVSGATDSSRAADEIEDLAYLLRQAVRSFPLGTQITTSVGFGDRAEVGGVQYPTGTVEILVKDRDRGATIP